MSITREDQRAKFADKNQRRKLFNAATPGHKDGRKLRKQSPHGAFGDKSRAAANVELMILGTIRENQ